MLNLDVPGAFVASYGRNAWVDGLPGLTAEVLDRWDLRPDGPATHGMAALVLPVIRHDGTPAVLKLQEPRDETTGAVLGLRAWDGHGVVRMLEGDAATGAMLLERLDADRPLSTVGDDTEAMEILAGLLARLVAVPAPEGLRHLSDIAGEML